MRGKAIPDEIRVAIAADLEAGDTRKAVAARYGVSEGSVAKYSPLAKRGRVYRDRLVSINQLGDRYLDLLDKNFTALGVLADYIAAHPKEAAGNGQGLAILYGVVFDKTGNLAGAAVASAGMGPAALPDAEGADTGSRPALDDDQADAETPT
jgi:hypothetical protein